MDVVTLKRERDVSFRAGDRFGEYEIIGVLGAGGMGEVFKARHLISERIEAIKVLLPAMTANPDQAERFVREIRVQASLLHPNIAALHNALRSENQLLLVMEFVAGESIAKMLKEQPIASRRAIDICMSVLSGLSHAHAKGVIHRDIKPSNIMLNEEGVVKILDFGIARGAIEAASLLTEPGTALGSIRYMSPEQIRAEHVDGRSDLYSTGVTLFEMVTGRAPFEANNAGALLQMHLAQTAPLARDYNPRVSAALSSLIAKALEKDPAKRFQTADEFRLALSGVSLDTESAAGEAPLRTAAPASGQTTTATRPLRFDPVGLERVRRELSEHIGPIATVIVNRVAKRAITWQELYDQLAPEIPPGPDRDKFRMQQPRD